jgi:UDP-N-acetylglucosamine 2-epimerase (non-hydrolysing)
MRRDQSLGDLSGRLISRLGRFFEEHPARAVLVQGDTSTALFGGLAAFYHRIPVGHVEAGLRTGDRYAPFPEEMNRRLLGSIATWHFTPTREAVLRLRHEGVASSAIHLTGNTGVDALRWMAPRCRPGKLPKPIRALLTSNRKLLLVTCHRRESFGQPMKDVARALARIAGGHPEVQLLFPLHPNPSVRAVMRPALDSYRNVVLCDPLDYDAFLACLKRAWLVLSDSGGVQEEATALGIPVLVLRNKTERAEGVKAGALKLVGTDPDRIVRACARLLRDPAAHDVMSRASDVFGDGRAAVRIASLLEASFKTTGVV